jgi:hypothetical protein
MKVHDKDKEANELVDKDTNWLMVSLIKVSSFFFFFSKMKMMLRAFVGE